MDFHAGFTWSSKSLGTCQQLADSTWVENVNEVELQPNLQNCFQVLFLFNSQQILSEIGILDALFVAKLIFEISVLHELEFGFVLNTWAKHVPAVKKEFPNIFPINFLGSFFDKWKKNKWKETVSFKVIFFSCIWLKWTLWTVSSVPCKTRSFRYVCFDTCWTHVF